MKGRLWELCRDWRAVLLLALGLAAMAGDLLHLTPLFAVATAFGASPAPKVFTAREGLEGFSSRFVFEGEQGRFVLDPEANARLRGPYNRRNVYGAALAGGPFLVDHPHLGELHNTVSRYAFCREQGILNEIADINSPPIGPLVAVHVEARPGTKTTLPLHLSSACAPIPAGAR